MDDSFFAHGRDRIKYDNGPWSSMEDYALAIAHRELATTKQRSRFTNQQGFYYGPGQYQPNTECKLQTLTGFMKVAKYLKPQDPTLSKGILWHTDLHSENIFVDENDPTQITAIIDWQGLQIAPMFAQVRHPAFLDFEGEVVEGYDINDIKLPENYEQLNEAEQNAARRKRGAQLIWKLYDVEQMINCKEVRRALVFHEGLLGKLFSFARMAADDGELLLQRDLMELQDRWAELVEDPVTEPCPLQFTERDRAVHQAQYELWTQGIMLKQDFLQKMGAFRGWEGWVSHEQYEDGKRNMQLLKEEFLEQHASNEIEREEWLQAWPFRDE